LRSYRGISIFLALLWCYALANSQTISYSGGNTSTSVIPYPGTIPCPNSSCTGGGSLTGANYTLTPTDFNLPITRVTDNSTMSTTKIYGWSYSGGAYPNPFDTTDTRFVVYTGGNDVIPMQWNPNTNTATKLYGAAYTLTTPYPSGLTFSYITPYVAYGIAVNGSNNAAIYSYDFTSTSVAPTGVQVVDLTTCAPDLVGLGVPTSGDLFVSKDDQTFGINISSTSIQDSVGDVYAIIWNRTNGCRLWNTRTGAVTGAWGTTGTIAVTDRFQMHYLEMSKGGDWAFITFNNCVANCYVAPGTEIWHVADLSVYQLNDPTTGCGHTNTGYNFTVNECDAGGGHFQATWYSRRENTPNSSTIINPNSIPNYTTPLWDQHPSWPTDNPTDTNPFCTTIFNGQFSVSGAYDNEVQCHAMDGTGRVWRFAHTYSTHSCTPSFESCNAIGSVSADGKWFLWTSDWDGMLGNTSGVSNTCTLNTNCRNDIFIMALPTLLNGGGSIINGTSKIGGQASIH
jgi:hypothetical protein